MNRLVICYKKYESFYEDNDIERNEWVYFLGTVDEFKQMHPDLKIIFVFNEKEKNVFNKKM